MRPPVHFAWMAITESDRTAADVAWDLEPLLDHQGPDGVAALLDQADELASAVAKRSASEIETGAEGGSVSSA